MNNKQKRDFIWKIVESLLNVCDGAIKKDGCGFNKFDTQIAREMYEKYRLDGIPTGKMEYLRKILLKYKSQITGFEYEYDELLKPLDLSQRMIDIDVSVTLNETSGFLVIKTPFKEEAVHDFHEIRGMSYQKDIKSNILYPDKDFGNVKKLIDVLKKHFDYEMNQDLIDKLSLGIAYINKKDGDADYLVHINDKNDQEIGEFLEKNGFLKNVKKSDDVDNGQKYDVFYTKRIPLYWRLPRIQEKKQKSKVAADIIIDINKTEEFLVKNRINVKREFFNPIKTELLKLVTIVD